MFSAQFLIFLYGALFVPLHSTHFDSSGLNEGVFSISLIRQNVYDGSFIVELSSETRDINVRVDDKDVETSTDFKTTVVYLSHNKLFWVDYFSKIHNIPCKIISGEK